jgi:cbb3-type cytochrome oxidase subunit 1
MDSMNRKLGIDFLKSSLIYFSITIAIGTIMTLMPVYNFVIQSALFERAHAHLSLIGWVSFAIIGFIYIGLDYLNKPMYSERLGLSGFYLFNIGISVEVITLLIGGYDQAHAAMIGDLHPYVYAIPYTAFTMIFAFVMLTGAYMTIYNIYKTLKTPLYENK